MRRELSASRQTWIFRSGERRKRWATLIFAIAMMVAFGGTAAAKSPAPPPAPHDVTAAYDWVSFENGPAFTDAGAFVAAVGQNVINVLAKPDDVAEERNRHFRDIFSRALDLEMMARRVLGRHWRRVTKEQKEDYVRLFHDYVLRIYAVQLGAYGGEKFTVIRQQAANKTESVVAARIVREHGHGAPLDLSFRVRWTAFGYRIIDVTVAGVSLVVTKRSEFDSIIRREGMHGLLKRLDATRSARRKPDLVGPLSLIAEAITAIKSVPMMLLFQQ